MAKLIHPKPGQLTAVDPDEVAGVTCHDNVIRFHLRGRDLWIGVSYENIDEAQKAFVGHVETINRGKSK